jgi:hypothetical protein
MKRLIQDYKNLALQSAKNFTLAGQYNMVALKLQEICDRLPAPNLKVHTDNTLGVPVKTANITDEEQERINAEWKNKAKS